jgi:DNA-binding transcriptional LysR family regulator
MKPFSQPFTIDFRRLRVLRELSQRGTVGATAGALNLTPSAVSQQIAALSREAGVPLLVPQGRGVRLTPQALLLLDHAVAIESQLERPRADLAAFRTGTSRHVALGAFATAIAGLVAPALARLARERPGLRLSVLETEAPECFTRLDAGALDLVITVDHSSGPGRSDPRYRRLELLDDPLLAALPPDHPLAARPAVALEELAADPWIVGAMRGPCQEVGLAACAASGFTPQVRHHANDWAAVFALVAAGCGVALVPRLAAGGPPRGVALRPLDGPRRPSRHLYAAIRAGSETHPCLAPVLEALRQSAEDR